MTPLENEAWTMQTGRDDGKGKPRAADPVRGIVIPRGELKAPRTPRIQAFIWGGKVRPSPTLPYGHRKGAA